MTLQCPRCNHSLSTVTDTRRRADGIRRRRKCFKCGNRFWTVETLIPAKLQKIEEA